MGVHVIRPWCHTGGYHVPPMTFTGSVREDIVFLDPVIGVGEVAISSARDGCPGFRRRGRDFERARWVSRVSSRVSAFFYRIIDGVH
ncbi:MAG: hypothetical protein CVV18_03655 [Gammaproteobacteria bacterium HGW-Gammaproteobacteria-8]|nr:MAG: hypothetical protein CVV18_03655 [Gammaproteobacteria bacterium HGW-Gammaproteobacteria-8]